MHAYSYRSGKIPGLQSSCICPYSCTPTKHMKHTHKSTSCHRYCFSNIHIFHDVHQYNKTLIDLHYNYFMYFSFSFSLLSFTSSQPCLVSNPIPNDSTINLSINKSKGKEKDQIKLSTLPMILQSCPSCKA